jgi:transposase
MSQGRSHFPRDPETLLTLVENQAALITKLQQELDQLKFAYGKLLKDRFGQKSEKLAAGQLALFDLPEKIAPSAPSMPEDEDGEPEVKRRRGGRRKRPESLPREVIEHDLSPKEKCCPDCGHMRERIGAETSEQLEYVPATLKGLEHVRYKYACPNCQEHGAIAEKPAKPVEKGLPGPGLLSAVGVGKFGEHLPLYRLEDIFARFGVEISRGTQCRWLKHTAELLTPVYELMIERILRSRVIHTDDTPVSVLDPSLPKTRTGRFWVYAGDADHPYLIYVYTPSRKRDGPMEFLKDYEGYLVADAFSGYDGIYATKNVTQVLCWAHARRKFHEAQSVQALEAQTALAFIARLYKLEREALAVRPEDFATNPQARIEWYEQRKELRQDRACPILDSFHNWLLDTKGCVLPKSPVGQALRYVLSRWEGFVRYTSDGQLPIDNNLSERSLRPCAIGRKNWLFLGNDPAGKTAAIWMSLLASAKAHEVEPWVYLRDLIDHLSQVNHRANSLEADPIPPSLDLWLPDAYLASHPSAYRQRSR